MDKVFYDSHLKERRKSLRNEMTPAEVILWSKLRGKQLIGLKFRRQASIGSYIADFYCPSEQVVIEVDGDTHYTEDAKAYDEVRSNYLMSVGIRVIRFTNDEVVNNIDGVLYTIAENIKQHSTT